MMLRKINQSRKGVGELGEAYEYCRFLKGKL